MDFPSSEFEEDINGFLMRNHIDHIFIYFYGGIRICVERKGADSLDVNWYASKNDGFLGMSFTSPKVDYS